MQIDLTTFLVWFLIMGDSSQLGNTKLDAKKGLVKKYNCSPTFTEQKKPCWLSGKS